MAAEMRICARCSARQRKRASATACRCRIEQVYATLEQLRSARAKILSMTQVKASLEEYFMHLVEADRAQAAAVEVSGK